MKAKYTIRERERGSECDERIWNKGENVDKNKVERERERKKEAQNLDFTSFTKRSKNNSSSVNKLTRID